MTALAVAVTGASGQVGTALLRSRPANVAVTALSRRAPVGAARHVAVDLAFPLDADLDLKEVDVAVLLASRISTSTDIGDIADQLKLELRSSLSLLERMPAVKYVVYASSCTVYGTPAHFPVAETTSLRPANIYACAKVATEHMLRLALARRAIPLAILRIAQVFGPTSPDAEIIARFCRMVAARQAPSVSCGTEVFRDYVHEHDVATSIWSAIERRVDGTFNIGGGQPTTIASLARSSCTIGGLREEPVITASATTFSMLLDIERARQHLDYSPELTPHDEMRRRLEWQ